MGRRFNRRMERIERYLVRLIQQPGADQGHKGSTRLLLSILKGVSQIFRVVVSIRLFFYEVGILRRYPLGCQVNHRCEEYHGWWYRQNTGSRDICARAPQIGPESGYIESGVPQKRAPLVSEAV